MANFGLFLRGQPLSRDINCCMCQFSIRRTPGTSKRSWVCKPSQEPTFNVLFVMPDHSTETLNFYCNDLLVDIVIYYLG